MQEENIYNPYKTSSPLDANCIGKAAFAFVAGGGFGLVMAMFMNAVEMRQIEIGKIRRSTAIILRKDWRRILSTGKGFATFGGFFVLFQCMIQHVRCKQDGLNSFLAGMATSIVLGANGILIIMTVMNRRELIISGMGGGFMCLIMWKAFKLLGY